MYAILIMDCLFGDLAIPILTEQLEASDSKAMGYVLSTIDGMLQDLLYDGLEPSSKMIPPRSAPTILSLVSVYHPIGMNLSTAL